MTKGDRPKRRLGYYWEIDKKMSFSESGKLGSKFGVLTPLGFVVRTSQEYWSVQMKIFYESEAELLTIFWAEPRETQIAEELDNDGILIKDEVSGESLGLEFFCYRKDDRRLLEIQNEVNEALLPSR
jgi:uncharacterized protein YuzE